MIISKLRNCTWKVLFAYFQMFSIAFQFNIIKFTFISISHPIKTTIPKAWTF